MKRKIISFMLFSILALSLCACADNTETFRITFDSQSGTTISSCKNIVETEPIPVKVGYEFCGWYENEDFTGSRLTFPYAAAQNIVLYANWQLVDEQAVVIDIFTKRAKGQEAIKQFDEQWYIDRTSKQDNKFVYTRKIKVNAASSNSEEEYQFTYDSDNDLFFIGGVQKIKAATVTFIGAINLTFQ